METRAIVQGTRVTVEFRVAEEDGSALFVKPASLDGDGEFYIATGALLSALARLGIDVRDYERGPWQETDVR